MPTPIFRRRGVKGHKHFTCKNTKLFKHTTLTTIKTGFQASCSLPRFPLISSLYFSFNSTGKKLASMKSYHFEAASKNLRKIFSMTLSPSPDEAIARTKLCLLICFFFPSIVRANPSRQIGQLAITEAKCIDFNYVEIFIRR